MKKAVFAVLAILGLTMVFAAVASAQDQTIAFDPPSVDAAGEHEITITGTGFTVDVFILPCAGAEGDLAALTDATAQCDVGALTPASPDADGNISATVTLDIPEVGLVIAAGDQAQTNSAVGVITVGAAEEGGDEAAAEEEAGAAEEEAVAAEESAGSDELANTGVESGLLAIIGATIVAGGALVVLAQRRSQLL